jgi:formylglycine-generating enzyme
MTPFGGNGANRPATGVSWFEAARFVNWLNTSTGNSPAYKFAIQPGQAGYSADASIQLWTPSDPGYNPNNLYRNNLARYFMSSDDEWYKAAYYDPSSGVYYDYPTGSDTAPAPVASGTAAGTAVYAQPFNQGPTDITIAGGLSPYGTMGQGGNVYQWSETDMDLINDSTSSIGRTVRGGDWFGGSSNLLSTSRKLSANSQDSNISFRVTSIPEPSAILLAGFAAVGLFELVALRYRRIAGPRIRHL